MVLDVNPLAVVRRVILAAASGSLPEENRRDAVVLLTEALRSPDEDLRGLAVIGLHEINSPTNVVVPALHCALSDPSDLVRRRAIRALGDLGKAAIPALNGLIRALEDSNPSIRTEAIGAIRRLGTVAGQAIPGLVRLLMVDECRIRTLVGVTLREMGSPSTPYLLALLNDVDPDIRNKAITLIGQMNVVNDDVIHGLLEACSDSNEDCRHAAREAIDRLDL